MPVAHFPDPDRTGPDGIVALGGDLHPDSLILAYRQGIFPWPHAGLPLLWFCPPQRAILDFSDLHIPRRLARVRRQIRLRFTVDQAFDLVIHACRNVPRRAQAGTWITPEIIAGYTALHRQGIAHSVEAWEMGTGNLVGGLYGVCVDGVFSGESMFHVRSDASKLALLFLVDYLSERGLKWLDIQQMTPHLAALGAVEIPRAQFLERLKTTQQRNLSLFADYSNYSRSSISES